MENLSLEDRPPSGFVQQRDVPTPPPGSTVPQLPPQMFTTAAQLLDLTDSES
jgi:U6 snRNA-associated Sm-like protein LSm1